MRIMCTQVEDIVSDNFSFEKILTAIDGLGWVECLVLRIQ